MTAEVQPVNQPQGRPRPPDTIERDNHVHAVMVKHGAPATRSQIAELAGIKPSYAYLSLIRLRRDGRVKRADAHNWEVVAPPVA